MGVPVDDCFEASQSIPGTRGLDVAVPRPGDSQGIRGHRPGEVEVAETRVHSERPYHPGGETDGDSRFDFLEVSD